MSPTEKGTEPRYPHVRVSLRTGNPYLLVAKVRQEMRSAGLEREVIGSFTSEALAGSEDQTRRTCATWVDTGQRDSERTIEADLD